MIARLARQIKFFRTIDQLSFRMMSVMFVVFFAITASGEDALPDDATAQVIGVDHAFDGGSLLVEIDVKGEAHYMLIVSPNSPIYRRVKSGSMPILWSSDKRFQDQERGEFTRDDLKRVVGALVRSKKGKLNGSVASVLLGIHAGMKIHVWGSKAVELISDGNWVVLFSERRDDE